MRSLQYRLTRGTTYALLPALAVLALAGCGSDGDSGSQPSSTPSSPAATETPSTVTTPTPPVSTPSNTATSEAPADIDVTITATVAGGKLNPSTQTVKAEQGQKIMVTVTSDEADELHIHGYDKELPLTAGKAGSVTFTADTKGTFEIETHESGKLIAKLIVT